MDVFLDIGTEMVTSEFGGDVLVLALCGVDGETDGDSDLSWLRFCSQICFAANVQCADDFSIGHEWFVEIDGWVYADRGPCFSRQG